MLLSKFSVCNSKKSKFIKAQEARGIVKQLRNRNNFKSIFFVILSIK